MDWRMWVFKLVYFEIISINNLITLYCSTILYSTIITSTSFHTISFSNLAQMKWIEIYSEILHPRFRIFSFFFQGNSSFLDIRIENDGNVAKIFRPQIMLLQPPFCVMHRLRWLVVKDLAVSLFSFEYLILSNTTKEKPKYEIRCQEDQI